MLILCGSVSSWIEKNIVSSTAFLGRPSRIIKLEALSPSYVLLKARFLMLKTTL